MTEPDPSVPILHPPDLGAPAAGAAPVSIPPAPRGMPPMPPTPIVALPYAFAAPRISRPGVVTSIGVISIVVASLSALASLIGGCQAGAYYALSTMAANMPAPTPPSTPAPSTTTYTTTANATSYTPYSVSPGVGSTSMPSTALTAAQINSAVQGVQWTAGTPPTQAQIAGLRAALANPSQPFVPPGTPASSPSSGVIDGAGNAYITFSNGQVVSLNPQGQPIPGPFAGNPMSMFKISKVACALTALEALLSLGLAIFLLVSAILMLRSSPSSRWLHLVYAVIKIPLVLGGTAAATWMNVEYYVSITSAMPGSAGMMRTMTIGWGVGFAVVGLIYPIALLIALNTRRTREYFTLAPIATLR